jgi:hypothetical protein
VPIFDSKRNRCCLLRLAACGHNVTFYNACDELKGPRYRMSGQLTASCHLTHEHGVDSLRLTYLMSKVIYMVCKPGRAMLSGIWLFLVLGNSQILDKIDGKRLASVNET